MAADLPKEFDVIVLGSGMPESIAAAAFSRIGQTVLHLDRNGYYSGDWASFNLQGIDKWAQQQMGTAIDDDDGPGIKRPDIDEKSLLQEGEQLVELPLQSSNFSNVDLQFHTRTEAEESMTQEPDVSNNCETDIVKEIPDITHSTEKTCDHDDHFSSDKDVLVGSGDSDKKEMLNKLSESVRANEEYGDNSKTENLEEKLGELHVKPDTETSTGDTSHEPASKENKEPADVDKSQETIDSNSSVLDDVDNSQNIVTDNDKQEGCDKGTCDSVNNADSIDKEVKQVEGYGNAENVVEQDSGPKEWTEKSLKAEWRRFNLDLSPKVLYCGGEMVELLITSDIAKYCEFKTVTRVLTVIDGKVEKVPCSRADVFSSKKVSMLEKRMLMKFLQFCLDYQNKTEEIQDFLAKPFSEFLSSRKLTANLKHFVQHSIAMATDTMTTKQGLERTQKFLKSVGRYGNTAFLWSLYGSGELPQSFCRMCAVFGGVYCLRMSASSMITDQDNKCQGIITTEGQRIACKWLIMESSYSPDVFLCRENKRCISRGIIIADRPLLQCQTDAQELSMLCVPCPDDGDRPVLVLELPPGAMACPPGVYVFHLTRQSREGLLHKDDLAHAVDVLFQPGDSEEDIDKPRILWSLYFTQDDMSCINVSDKLPGNVFLMSGPGTEVDIDRPVQEAREVFHKILPEEEFLPKAPNPEDIIYVDDSETKVTEDSSQSEFAEQDTSQSQTGKVETEIQKVEQEAGSRSEQRKDSNQSEAKDTCQSEDSSESSQSATKTAVGETETCNDSSQS